MRGVGRRAPGSAGWTFGYWLYLIPGVLLLSLVILLPFAASVGLSFTRWSGLGTPTWVGLDNYLALTEDDTFIASFQNLIAMVVALVVVPTLAGIVIAFGLFDFISRRFHTSVASVLRATYFLPQIIPVVIAGLVWGYIFSPDGSLNTFLETVGLGGLASDWLGQPGLALGSLMVVLVWVQIGYAVVVFMAGLGRVSPELYEAAELDGAGTLWRFRAIAIPHIRPELFVVTLISTVAALKVFGPVYSLTFGGPGTATYVPSYYSYQTYFQRLQVGYGAAMSVVLAALVIVVAALILYFQSRSQKKDAA